MTYIENEPTDSFGKVNPRPVAAFAGNTSRDIVHIKAKPEETIELSAVGSTDPDGDRISFHWFQCRKAGILPAELNFENSDKAEASLTLGPFSRQGTNHIILKVYDDGEPGLCSYRRIIITAEP